LFHRPFYEWLITKFPDWKQYGRGGKLIQGAAASISVTVSAMVLTTPLCAYHFGAVSLVGPLTNVLVLWVISFVFYGILAVCALNLVWGSGAVLLARIVSLPIRYVLFCAETLASFPLAAVYTRSVYITFWLIFCYILLGAFWIFKRKGVRLLAGCMLVSLLMSVTLSWVEPLMHNTRMTMLDVGQGQCLVLHTDGKTYLIDCGGSGEDTGEIATRYLRQKGIFHIDGVILTHFDADHTQGLTQLLCRIPVNAVYHPAPAEGEREFLHQLAPITTLHLITEAAELSFGETALRLYPVGTAQTGENESGLCILAAGEKCDILVTGDLGAEKERELLSRYILPDVEILVAGHHGSRYSTSRPLLDAVKPELALISVGENSYGHPHDDALNRLTALGAEVYTTLDNGNLTIRW
jgi:competence protein ComEC